MTTGTRVDLAEQVRQARERVELAERELDEAVSELGRLLARLLASRYDPDETRCEL